VRNITAGISSTIRRRPLATLTFTLWIVKVSILFASVILEITGSITAGAAAARVFFGRTIVVAAAVVGVSTSSVGADILLDILLAICFVYYIVII
jgi:hypothetical protein